VAALLLGTCATEAHSLRMKLRIKIRHRALPPKPWKWEIHGDRLLTSSHQSYVSQAAAHRAARPVLTAMIAELALVNRLK
jgi:hypothetical protein